MNPLIDEVACAFASPRTPLGRTCFVSNEAVEALRRHGRAVLPAIEHVVRRCVAASSPEGGNLQHLLMVYFDVAADAGVDPSTFFRSLEGRPLQDAFRAVFQIWGPHNPARRRTIHPALFAAWQELRPRSLHFSWREDTLSETVADGRLWVEAPAMENGTFT